MPQSRRPGLLAFTVQSSQEVAVDADSTYAFIGVTGNTSVDSVAGWNQNFQNVTWNCLNQTAIFAANANGGGTTTNISGNFTEIIVTCKYHGQRDGDADR
jgi:hypothetical protein